MLLGLLCANVIGDKGEVYMSLEQRIKALEEQLALKNAYLNVEIAFNKEVKVNAKIKKLVTTKVKEICLELAEGIERTSQSESSGLSDAELDVLKQLASKVLGKSAKTPKNPISEPKEEPVSKAKELSAKHGGEFASILMTDNINKQFRDKVSSEAMVKVLNHDKNVARVLTEDGIEFNMPIMDLEFQNQ